MPADLHPAVVDAVPRALAWLYDTVQPDDAVQHHLGKNVWIPAANRHLRMFPAPRPVLVIEVSSLECGRPDELPRNPLRPGELDELAVVVAGHRRTVLDRWNGHPAASGSLQLAEAPHRSLLAAVERYTAGCPGHRDVFCGGWQAGNSRLAPLASCEAWRRGFRRTVPPPTAADAAEVGRG